METEKLFGVLFYLNNIDAIAILCLSIHFMYISVTFTATNIPTLPVCRVPKGEGLGHTASITTH